VSKYAHGAPRAKPRPRRASKLDPFRDQVRRWVEVDHLYNCETLFQRLQAVGYTGKISILKDLVRPWRPRAVGKRPLVRFETKPGEQMQFDWGEFVRHASCVDHCSTQPQGWGLSLLFHQQYSRR
jgi:transposase